MIMKNNIMLPNKGTGEKYLYNEKDHIIEWKDSCCTMKCTYE